MPYSQQYYARPHTGYDYGQAAMTGTNGLVIGSPVWPTPSSSGETMDKLKAWLDKPTMESYPSVKNKHVAIVVGVSAVAGLAWYGNKHRWF
jgi:hypothetical protein